MKRFTNCESCAFGQLVDSDHRVVKCSFRFFVHLQRKRDPRSRLTCLDYTLLLDSHIKQKFIETIIVSLDNKPPSDVSHTHLTHILSTTTTTMLPKRARATPLRLASSIETLRDSLEHRNKAFDSFHKSPTPINKVKYAESRRIARLRVRQS